VPDRAQAAHAGLDHIAQMRGGPPAPPHVRLAAAISRENATAE